MKIKEGDTVQLRSDDGAYVGVVKKIIHNTYYVMCYVQFPRGPHDIKSGWFELKHVEKLNK